MIASTAIATPAPIPALVPVLMPVAPSTCDCAVDAGDDDGDAAVGGAVIDEDRLLEVMEGELDVVVDAELDVEIVEVGRKPCCQTTEPPREVGRATILVKVGASVKATVRGV